METALLEPAAKVSSTSELATPRKRAYDLIPADAPLEKVRVRLQAEVEYSLRDLCGNWPTGEFDRVVSDVTSTAMKYHDRHQPNARAVTAANTLSPHLGLFGLFAAVMHAVQRFLRLETLPLG
jgi:hypothetical protein